MLPWRDGVEVDKKKANYYREIAAIKGRVQARNNLGANEYYAGAIIIEQ